MSPAASQPPASEWRTSVRTLLLWCLPALLVGLVLRTVLWVRMPHAFYHQDSDQVFETFLHLRDGSLWIHGKKTPIGPLLFCIPLLLGLPVLPTIALVQHVLGLGLVAGIGALAMFSLRCWRIFIIPVTLLAAIHPDLLWYEHVSLPETFYVLAIVAAAVTGLLYQRRPGLARLTALATALFFTAGLRPEGKIFCLFGLALVAWVLWGKGRRQWLTRVGAMVLLTVLCLILNRTDQSGSLLLSNVAHLTPDELRTAPGFVAANQAYFDDLRQRWSEGPRRDIARERKHLLKAAREYLGRGQKVSGETVNRFCSRIGAEICLRNLHRLPGLAVTKFRFALRNSVADDFGSDYVHRKQLATLAGAASLPDKLAAGDEDAVALARLAYGRTFASRAEMETHLLRTYRPFQPDWLTRWQEAYATGVHAWRLPDEWIDEEDIPGLPFIYLAPVAGLIALALRDRSQRPFHLCWLGTLLLLAFVLTLTGSNLGRFRIGFEPFLFLYALALLDVALDLLARLSARRCSGRKQCADIAAAP